MLFFFFFVGCQIRHKFVYQKLVCEFNNTLSCHTEFTTRSTLILTPNVNTQGLLIRISADENLRYTVLFKTFPAIGFDPINFASPINTVNVYIIWLYLTPDNSWCKQQLLLNGNICHTSKDFLSIDQDQKSLSRLLTAKPDKNRWKVNIAKDVWMSNKLLLLITESQKSPTANHLHCCCFCLVVRSNINLFIKN